MKKSFIDDLCLVFIDTFCQYTPQQGWNRAFYFWEVIRLMCIESIFHSRFSFQMWKFFVLISYLIVWFSFEIQIDKSNNEIQTFIVLSNCIINYRMKISIWFMYLKILFVQFIFTSHIHHLLTLEAIHMNQRQIIYSSSAFFS